MRILPRTLMPPQDLWQATGWLARVVLGACFVRLGWNKAMDPGDFLKLVHQYPIPGWDRTLMPTWIAAWLPWFEVFCGGMLLLGYRVRGTALMSLGTLAVFSSAVVFRALEVQRVTGLPFCGIRFDCGCGNGEVPVCRKLLENALLMGVCCVAWAGRGIRR